VGYRLLEFNLGVCLFHFMDTQSDVTTRVLFVLNRAAGGIELLFTLIWLSQIESEAPRTSDTCVGMYYFRLYYILCALYPRTPRYVDAWVCSRGQRHRLYPTTIVVPGSVTVPAAPLSALLVLASAVLFLWPLCYVLTLLMQINLSTVLIQDNISLIVFIMPVAALCVAYLWNQTLKMLCSRSPSSSWGWWRGGDRETQRVLY